MIVVIARISGFFSGLLVGSRTHGRGTLVLAKVPKAIRSDAQPFGFPAILTNAGRTRKLASKKRWLKHARRLSGVGSVSRLRISRNNLISYIVGATLLR